MLNYEEDPEITTAIANIPPQSEDVRMLEADPPPGFELEFSCIGFDHNLVRASENTGLGSNFLVTAREDWMLDEDPQTKAPGTGRLGLNENPGCSITKKG